MFIGEFTVKLTENNRVVLPVNFREELEDTLELFINSSQKYKVEIFDSKNLDQLQIHLSEVSMLHSEIRRFEQIFYSQLEQIKLDAQGRFILSKKSLDNIQLKGKSLKIIGVKDHVEIWDELRWDAYKLSNIKQFDSLTDQIARIIDGK
jgi:division/cell wall cluster transcriptional repressor MraZ